VFKSVEWIQLAEDRVKGWALLKLIQTLIHINFVKIINKFSYLTLLHLDMQITFKTLWVWTHSITRSGLLT